MDEQIDIFKALNFIRDNSEKYAQAKAVENEEKLRWMLEAAKLKIDAWRTIESNKRAERII